MEAAYIKETLTQDTAFFCVLKNFFKNHTPDSTNALFWKFFQCWVTKDCNIKADLSDEEVALFFDQLMDLVAAAYILHEANRVPTNQQEGKDNE